MKFVRYLIVSVVKMKFVRYLIVSVVVVALWLLGSLVKPANEAGLAQGQVGCTVTVESSEIQSAIDQAPEGAVICVALGTWRATLTITKSLTLRGVGGKTYFGYPSAVIENLGIDRPVITIWSDSPIDVKIEGLTVLNRSIEEVSAISIGGQAKVTITDCLITSREYWHGGWIIWSKGPGIWIGGSAQVTIIGSEVRGHAREGILIGGSAQAVILGSTVSECARDYRYYYWGAGIRIEGSAQAVITSSQVSDNDYYGILIMDSAQATITDSRVSSNGRHGIWMRGSAQAEIIGSTIEDNGEEEHDYGVLSNGILVQDKSQVKIRDSTIRGNGDWGVGAYLKKCGCGEDNFTGQVIFEGANTIEGNNRDRGLRRWGNPGNHPWNQPGVDDGQVCLP